jgi:hypothetical protein
MRVCLRSTSSQSPAGRGEFCLARIQRHMMLERSNPATVSYKVVLFEFSNQYLHRQEHSTVSYTCGARVQMSTPFRAVIAAACCRHRPCGSSSLSAAKEDGTKEQTSSGCEHSATAEVISRGTHCFTPPWTWHWQYCAVQYGELGLGQWKWALRVVLRRMT